ncbi:MAG: tRNA (adenosine(37)-N6)-threonylcarbamoyltransferase complex dimerization subunit type 1 TsaB [Francisellaceae bacterium]|jgi:tRNA threonylcarbamoyladenosine biosynthesis protein TsaB|nr:tRNA (adenosine(37)-N6)-threonylcarbamoyltransferase complex dimerization subunit type 1 TsaB [Francisellaceae bacterium]MBT6207745.1 tRNA (adenosine(37)-N6)-threonylcarbamoyltransferase complex dimerization subunit type 1 TsaB [Francisellaceae bacterium]MBT6539056.1 tRNA (adenosine(37)-N6)-threonylcarbamoyltransferase complex dimerization subunit type 1 TsaB [Francisellaceae bacterium]
MNILSIDTSNQYCSIAIITENNSANFHVEAKNLQSQLILKYIDTLLNDLNLELDQIDTMIFGAGPGGFTGVRLAISIVKGLSITLNKIPIYGLSSTLSIAYELHCKEKINNVLVLQDARRDEFYYAQYTFSEDRINTVISDSMIATTKFVLPTDAEAICGSGLELLNNFNAKSIPNYPTPNALYQGMLAKLLISNASISNFNHTGPNYIRNNVVQAPSKTNTLPISKK